MSFTVTTVNVNGIRAAVKKRSEENLGLHAWLERSTADVVLMQEVRASDKQAREALAPALDSGWHWAGAESVAKGRAGVGILSRTPLTNIEIGFGSFADAGRWIAADLVEHGVRVASLYLPSGSADTAKQDEKYLFLDEFTDVLAVQAEAHENMVIGGDWNICHRRQDLKNWRTNRKKSGFLPDERAFMDSVFGTFPDDSTQVEGAGAFAGAVDYVRAEDLPERVIPDEPRWFDVARRLQPEGEGPYTWWTYRGKAFDTDAGWRIDYQAATGAMLERAEKTWVDKASDYALRWSDHSPLNVTYR